LAYRSAAIVTALLPKIGYQQAEKITHFMRENKTDIFTAAKSISNLDKSDVESMISPEAVNALGFVRKETQ
jgi:fumarate hydratase class II